ncbi:hypothetical protein PABG_11053 [Paracoccidioides brasiliensis Pb03]|nr:hypothetical protein PABG_11053 [Paracoccidioides brasiliensis Pb03]
MKQRQRASVSDKKSTEGHSRGSDQGDKVAQWLDGIDSRSAVSFQTLLYIKKKSCMLKMLEDQCREADSVMKNDASTQIIVMGFSVDEDSNTATSTLSHYHQIDYSNITP